MRKIRKIISSIIVFSILTYSLINILIQNKSLSVSQSISSEINVIDKTAYPKVQEMIQELKSKYPKWNFKILYTDLEWNEVIQNEYTGHKTSPKNLVYQSANYKGAWICSICGDLAYDNGSWKCASEEAIKYMMDPRNSLNESDIFQFEELSNNGCNIETLKIMTKGSFLEGHEQGIIDAANTNNVNAYYIAARLIQEQGKSGTVLTSGKGYNGQYEGYYNAFNIAASGNSTGEILTNALIYAQKKGWTTLEKSITEGISFLATQYIQKGQNTLYLQKFDVEATNGLYSHQYMQNILAAQNEGITLRNTYIETNTMSAEHTFIIPVYKNMPTEISSRPNSDSNSNSNVTIDLVKINVDSTLNIRNAPAGNTIVGSLTVGEIVTRIEKATQKVNGTYWDKILKSNGTTGYVARETYENEANYKLYLVPVTDNNSNSQNNNNTNEPTIPETQNKIKIDEQQKIITVVPDSIANDILEAFGGPTKITKADGGLLDGPSHKLATGFIVEDKYTVVKKGDINGDGKVDTADLLRIQKHLLQISLIENQVEKSAADLTKDNNINTADLLQLQKKLLGILDIQL